MDVIGRDESGEPLSKRAAWNAYLIANAPLQGRFAYRSPAWIERAQRRRVRRIVAHAYEQVPYYRETMDRLGLRPGELRGAADLARLPLLERDELQRDPEYFTARDLPGESCVRMFSGGTSGAPLAIHRDPFALFKDASARERHRAVMLRLAGKRWRLRQLTVVPSLAVGRATVGAFDRSSFLPRSLRVVSDQISLREPLPAVVARLDEFRPDLLSAHGSFVERLFAYLHDTGAPFHHPKVVFYGGDPVSEPIRRLITEEFGIAVTSGYGAMEAFNVGFECEEHSGLHLNVDLNPLRILDPEGREITDGRSGEVVVSNLVNRATVILNYRLGDLARMLPAPCPCGRTLPLLSFVEGRVSEWLRGPSGEPVHPQEVRALLEKELEILRYQVVQRDPTRYELVVVPRAGCDPSGLRDRIGRELDELLGSTVSLRVSIVEDLPRTGGDKTMPVVVPSDRTPA